LKDISEEKEKEKRWRKSGGDKNVYKNV